ncbi:MAG: mannose-1-phosphate guanylyltransferase [Candidatus Babeliales bacterium]
MKKHQYIVILAGGKGERLWPLSREKWPKQLLTIDNSSLLDHTIDRVQSLIPKSRLFIITTESQKKTIKKLVGHRIGGIIVEPESCNTAPAILLACLKIFEKDAYATIGFVPADHFIPDHNAFAQEFKHALNHATQENKIILLGIKPNWAATGYGYIEYEYQKNKLDNITHKVIRFHEKPTIKTAQYYGGLPNMLWNAGMFCANISVFLKEFEKHAPKLLKAVQGYLASSIEYNLCEKISIDYALLEKSTNISVLPVNFLWSDVGNLEIFLSLINQNVAQKLPIISINAKNNIINISDKLVALIGVNNLCVVETNDVLLIVQRDKTDKVKDVVTKLKTQKNEKYL